MSTTAASSPLNSSGKRLAMAVVLLAVLAAGVSWWFRYSQTHEAVKFWGPTGAALIRDARRVTLRTYDTTVEPAGDNPDALPRDLSSAPGLVHLRTKLIEDSSYDWAAKPPADVDWDNSLVFEETEGAEPRLVLLFSPDFQWVGNGSTGADTQPTLSCKPIAADLQKYFAAEAADAPLEQ